MTENIIVKELLNDTKYFGNVFQYLETKDFQDGACKSIYKLINEIYSTYNKSPNLSEIELYVESKSVSATEKTLLRTKIEDIKQMTESISKDILIDSTEAYIKKNRFYNEVILAGAEMLDGKTKSSQEDIQKKAEEINKISFKQSSGLDYIKDAEKNFKEYQMVNAAGIKSSLNIVNVATGGGYKPGTLTIYASVSNGGKTCFLINDAIEAMLQGKTVAYFSHEEEELDIRERLDACLMDKNTSEFKELGPSLKSSFDMIVGRGIGNLKIKSYGPRTASTLTMKAQLDEWKLKEGFIPDIIFDDSITIKKPIGKTDGLYATGKAVSEESKALGAELKIPIVSAVQFSKGSYGSSTPGMEDTAESLAIPQVASTMIGIILDEMRPDTRLLSIIKSRKINKSKVKADRVNINTDKQKVWDFSDDEKKRLYVKEEEKQQINYLNTIVEAGEKIDSTGSTSLDAIFGR